MSSTQVVSEMAALLQDPALGLAARVTALRAGDARILNEFLFVPWSLDGPLKNTLHPNVMLRPLTWQPEQSKADTVYRDSTCTVQIGYEYFGSVLVDIQDNLTVVATALAQVIDALRGYSDAHQKIIVEVLDGTTYTFGQFTGPTSHGFLANFTVSERSAQ